MTNNEESLTNSLVLLRKKSNKETFRSKFRPKLIGGLNEEDVKKYLSTLEEEYINIEQEMTRDMNELSDSKEKLKKDFEIYKVMVVEEKQKLLYRLNAAEESLAVNVEECRNKDMALQSLSDELNQLKFANNRIKEERAELERQFFMSQIEGEKIKESAVFTEKQKNVLNDKINDLEKEILSVTQQYEERKATCIQLEQQLEIEKSRDDKQNTAVEDLKRKVAEMEETITANMFEIEAQRRNCENLGKELEEEKGRALSSKISGFKDEVINLYQQLEKLTEDQEQVNAELQQQLENEQLRADRAETRMKELNKWIAELKEKLHMEQNLYESQFNQFKERHTRVQSEISSCLDNLQELENI